MDKDKSGDLNYQEFTEELWKMKSQHSHTVLMYVKHYVLQIWDNVQEQLKLVQSDLTRQGSETNVRLDAVSRALSIFSNSDLGGSPLPRSPAAMSSPAARDRVGLPSPTSSWRM